MKKIFSVFVFLGLCSLPALFAFGEKTLTIGGKSGWGLIQKRERINELSGLRPFNVLSISSAAEDTNSILDLYLSFDEGNPARFKDKANHYTIVTNANVQSADQRWARHGTGAALFLGISDLSYQNSGRNTAPLSIRPVNSAALLASGRKVGDFSIEFSLFPNNLATGEKILNWQASLKNPETGSLNSTKTALPNRIQGIACEVSKNRLSWRFDNFWLTADGRETKTIVFSSNKALSPKTWSHHLVRFDSETGLLEYLVDGIPQAALYTSSSGREGGDVYTPFTGEDGLLLVGTDFAGIIDEFKISREFIQNEKIERYQTSGGRVETKALDLGAFRSEINKITVTGGRVQFSSRAILNQYEKNGDFRFADDAEIQFFVRVADSPYQLDSVEWTPFKSGRQIYSIQGRYAQIAADFYPAGNLDAAPYLEEINVEYKMTPPPLPPERFTAIARDGAVDLMWKERRPDGAAGYIVYYGTKTGTYFGDDALQGPSPINVGKVSAVRLDNLKNGTLYYFSVSAYDESGVFSQGGLSKEVTARPSRMIE